MVVQNLGRGKKSRAVEAQGASESALRGFRREGGTGILRVRSREGSYAIEDADVVKSQRMRSASSRGFV